LTTYGYLYNWYSAADTKGLCPSGWHVPSDSDWTTLTTHLGGESIAGSKMKSTGTTLWTSPNPGATNESEFTGLPGGYRDIDGGFYYIRYSAFFWSATDIIYTVWFRNLNYSNGNVSRHSTFPENGFSVRCLKD
jgi:uncharacterized protein (TIGR02145 family)